MRKIQMKRKALEIMMANKVKAQKINRLKSKKEPPRKRI